MIIPLGTTKTSRVRTSWGFIFLFLKVAYALHLFISREKALEIRSNPAALYSNVIENLYLQSNLNTDDR